MTDTDNNPIPKQNSPEHMAMMRSRITSQQRDGLGRITKAAQRVTKLEAQLAEAKDALRVAQSEYEERRARRVVTAQGGTYHTHEQVLQALYALIEEGRKRGML